MLRLISLFVVFYHLSLVGCSNLPSVIPGSLNYSKISEKPLTFEDYHSDLEPLIKDNPDLIEKEKVMYTVTGKNTFDTFFKSTAISYGGLKITNNLLDDVNQELERLEKKTELDCTGFTHLITQRKHLGTAGVTVEASIQKSKELAPLGEQLLNSVKKEFSFIHAAEVTKFLNRSLDRLKTINSQGLALIKQTNDLSTKTSSMVTPALTGKC